MDATIDESRIKALFKEAMMEVLEERKDVVYEVLSEVIEDIAMVNAIREGENTESIGKQEILNILEGQS